MMCVDARIVSRIISVNMWFEKYKEYVYKYSVDNMDPYYGAYSFLTLNEFVFTFGIDVDRDNNHISYFVSFEDDTGNDIVTTVGTVENILLYIIDVAIDNKSISVLNEFNNAVSTLCSLTRTIYYDNLDKIECFIDFDEGVLGDKADEQTL